MSYYGPPTKWTPKAIKEILQMRKDGITVQKIGEHFDSDAGAIKSLLNRLKK